VSKATRWTESCSGCTELVDGQNVNGYPWDAKAKCYVGSGCRECGYTGKRRMQFDEETGGRFATPAKETP